MGDLEEIRDYVEGIRHRFQEVRDPKYGAAVTGILTSCNAIDRLTRRMEDAAANMLTASLAATAPQAPPATILEAPGPMSSVELAGRQKGPPAVTVKVYAADPVAARNEAVRLYNETLRMLEGHDSE